MHLALYRGVYAAVWSENGQVKRRSLKTDDPAEAQTRFDRFQREAAGRASTVAEALEVYCKALMERGGAEGAGWAAQPARQFLGAHGLDDLTEERCKAYYAHRKAQGRKDGTIIKELGVVRAALNHVKRNHGSTFWFPPAPLPRDRRITLQEFERLLDGAGSPHIRLFLELAAGTGARLSAVVGLRWRQCDLDIGLIDLRDAESGETNKRRAIVPMTARVKALLQQLRRQLDPAPYAHIIQWRGQPIANPKKAFRRAVERAGLAQVTPHVIRHSVATWMAEGRVPMAEIAAFLGHVDSRLTERIYAKYSPTYLAQAATVLNRECSPVQSEQLPVGEMG